MTINVAGIRRGRRLAPLRLMIYGPPGVGKTTLASDIPDAVFLDLEEGSENMDVARARTDDDAPLKTYPEVKEFIESLIRDPHDYKWLVFDTLDSLEQMIQWFVCHRPNEEARASIEDFGYGRGYAFALDTWRELIKLLEELREKRGVGVVFLAHTLVKSFRNPNGEDYDQYGLHLHEKVAGLIRRWCDMVGFAQLDVVIKKEKGALKAKAQWRGARMLHFLSQAGFFAKSRYAVPASMPLSWAKLQAALKEGLPGEPTELLAQVKEALAEYRKGGGHEDVAKEIEARVAKISRDGLALSKALDYLSGLINALPQATT